MAFCRVVFPLLILSVISCYASKVPVYMWGDLPKTSTKANPLMTVNPAEFKSILKQELYEDPLTIVFIEETLSVDDFSEKNSFGKTSFPYLQDKLNEAVYLPSVEHPLHVLNKRAEGLKLKIELTENGLSEEIPAKGSETGNFIFIALKDAREDESRPDFLQRHDKFMEDTMSKMEKYHDNVIAIYTGHYPSWIIPKATVHSRVRRDTNGTSSLSVNGLRLNAKSISLRSSNESTPLTAITSSTSEFNTTELSARLAFENDTTVTLHFITKGGYWFFDSVILSVGSLTEELFPAEEVYAIEGFSYRCADNVKFSSVNQSRDYTLNFNDLKIQPYFRDTNLTEPFGDSFNCVGFFTAPIWAGLFVVFILLFITFYGIMMMMDIRTMDRFDDPKGKTITINTAE